MFYVTNWVCRFNVHKKLLTSQSGVSRSRFFFTKLSQTFICRLVRHKILCHIVSSFSLDGTIRHRLPVTNWQVFKCFLYRFQYPCLCLGQFQDNFSILRTTLSLNFNLNLFQIAAITHRENARNWGYPVKVPRLVRLMHFAVVELNWYTEYEIVKLSNCQTARLRDCQTDIDT